MDASRTDPVAIDCDVILVTGDREWNDVDVMMREFEHIPITCTVVHGGARGADTMAGAIAEAMGMVVVVVPAQWSVYGKRAGPIRNRLMYDTYQPNIVYAFHKHIDSSKGTKDMITYAKKNGCSVRLIEK